MIDSLFMMVSIHHTSVLENHIPERSILMVIYSTGRHMFVDFSVEEKYLLEG